MPTTSPCCCWGLNYLQPKSPEPHSAQDREESRKTAGWTGHGLSNACIPPYHCSACSSDLCLDLTNLHYHGLMIPIQLIGKLATMNVFLMRITKPSWRVCVAETGENKPARGHTGGLLRKPCPGIVNRLLGQ